MTSKGLYCAEGDFYIDPWGKVDRAVITHAHSDHARSGLNRYLCSAESVDVLRLRIGDKASIQALQFGEKIDMGGVKVSLHPAGHILGSSQVRLESKTGVIVASGDYKTAPDRTCTAFEVVKCNTFITETTFGLPIYRWARELEVFEEINEWWKNNQVAGRTSILLGYALGKSQRALSGLEAEIGPIYQQDGIAPYTDAYRKAGVSLPVTRLTSTIGSDFKKGESMIIATQSSLASPWVNQIGPYSTAFLSGWMATKKMRKSNSGDRGFVLSDHVDWPSLLTAVSETGADQIYTNHGFSKEVAKYLSERGYDARVLPTHSSARPDEVA